LVPAALEVLLELLLLRLVQLLPAAVQVGNTTQELALLVEAVAEPPQTTQY
jgi:hypothetical protein